MVDQHQADGILIRATSTADLAASRRSLLAHAAYFGIDRSLEITLASDGHGQRFRLTPALRNEWMPGYDTLRLSEKLRLDPAGNDIDLEREIFLTMLASPVTLDYPSYEELASSIRIRRNIVKGSRRTMLSFRTSRIERPVDYWTYSDERGFTLLPGKPLIEALVKATQPEASGAQYSFSCYRATEYVTLLGIAQELVRCNPPLLRKLQGQWESRAIMSREFHDVFTREYGSMNAPLPARYFIPGDRLWFRNSDERSAKVMGYEGSWVFYLGGGMFGNFWKRDRPYTLASKCIEIYHWRDAVYLDASGHLQIDEASVEARVESTMRQRDETERILDHIMRLRDPQGTFGDGGCLDASREFPRSVCPGTSDLVLPASEELVAS